MMLWLGLAADETLGNFEILVFHAVGRCFAAVLPSFLLWNEGMGRQKVNLEGRNSARVKHTRKVRLDTYWKALRHMTHNKSKTDCVQEISSHWMEILTIATSPPYLNILSQPSSFMTTETTIDPSNCCTRASLDTQATIKKTIDFEIGQVQGAHLCLD